MVATTCKKRRSLNDRKYRHKRVELYSTLLCCVSFYGLFSFEQIQRTFAAGDGGLFLDGEIPAEGLLEAFFGIFIKNVLACGEQAVHL